MTGTSAAIGDDGRSALHHRLPIRVSEVGDQHVARLYLAHLAGILHQTHAANSDALADGASAHAHRRSLLERVALQNFQIAFPLHGFRPRLQDVQFAVCAIAPPLDVHRPPVVLLDTERIARQFFHLGIADREA